ncbi:CBS domain-containing protein [Streptomyces sp. NPDC092952]|uniref:CBS domain-containing protein n=1 Tax=Streptomyces sp. NPDC092952 TaxID=3366018 RepID=UPI0038045C25
MARPPLTVADVMSRKVVAVRPGAEFKEIVTAMDRWKVTALPVIEGEGRVVGVVSEADLVLKEELHDRGLGFVERLRRPGAAARAGSGRAEDLMTSPAVTVGPDASLPQAARMMATRHVKRLPVVDPRGLIQGVVSRSDLLKVFLRSDADLADEVRGDVGRLFPLSHDQVGVRVEAGVVILTGEVSDGELIPVAERLARTVEGVVDVRCELTSGGT